ncbi:MAG TPA: PEP-CTERM sorting domain-containing protein [Caldimonas sp.]|nr:PEP-CTERM sorting domain-containing protein [Caldimonas sp.]
MNVNGTRARAVALCMLIGAAAPASALPLFVSVQAGFTFDSASSASAVERSVTGVGVADIGTASTFARADFGSLGVSTSGTATHGPQVSGATIVGRSEATFQDLLFIGGPEGMPVELTFTLQLDGTCVALPDAFHASCDASGSVALPGSGVAVSAGGAHFNSTTIAWVAGSAIGINGAMLAMGSAIDGSYEAAFADTLHFYVSSPTPGVEITSQSGHDYSLPIAAAVPEPPTILLLATGLLFVARRRMRTG